MANIYKGTLGLIGNTPLVEVTNIEKKHNTKATILAKLEYFNPAGSVKDRIAKGMIEDAEATGARCRLRLSRWGIGPIQRRIRIWHRRIIRVRLR